MKVATIVSTPHLSLVRENDYHLCLAHLINKDKTYTAFYKQQAADKFVIMDNGAAEGKQPSIEELLDKAWTIGPQEIVLPDVVYDTRESLDRSYKMLSKISSIWPSPSKRPFKLMAVPQGNTIDEWVSCLKVMVTWPINTIGVTKFLTPKCGPDARLLALRESEQYWRFLDIHLLGCWSTPLEIARIRRVFNVRGTDSSIALVYAAHGMRLDPSTPRPEGEIDFSYMVPDVDLLRYNIFKWRELCHAAV